jgi:hypothetical protein
MSILVGQIAPVRTPVEETMEMFPMVMMIGMMGQMMGGMV